MTLLEFRTDSKEKLTYHFTMNEDFMFNPNMLAMTQFTCLFLHSSSTKPFGTIFLFRRALLFPVRSTNLSIFNV